MVQSCGSLQQRVPVQMNPVGLSVVPWQVSCAVERVTRVVFKSKSSRHFLSSEQKSSLRVMFV